MLTLRLLEWCPAAPSPSQLSNLAPKKILIKIFIPLSRIFFDYVIIKKKILSFSKII